MNMGVVLIWTHALYVILCITGIIEIIRTRKKLVAIRKKIGGKS